MKTDGDLGTLDVGCRAAVLSAVALQLTIAIKNSCLSFCLGSLEHYPGQYK